jgi:hypothetical protein
MNRRERKPNRLEGPVILIVGDGPPADDLRRELGSFDARLRLQHRAVDALDQLPEETAAIVLVAPLARVPLSRAVSIFKHSLQASDRPVLVLLPDPPSAAYRRSLEKRGADEVLEWPGEGRLLRRSLIDLGNLDDPA